MGFGFAYVVSFVDIQRCGISSAVGMSMDGFSRGIKRLRH